MTQLSCPALERPEGAPVRSLCAANGGGSALVVEGGAMRGIFACGVLDVFHEHAFQPFDVAIGCSVGACMLASHLAGQRGRNLRVFMQYMTRREFIDGRRFVRGGDWVDFDWLWHAIERDLPIDRAALAASPVQLVLSATSYRTGEPVYLEPVDHDLMSAFKSSCALPILCRDPVHVGEQRLMDGSIAAPIPVQEAYRRGARRILVIRSRPATFVARASAVGRQPLYRHSPQLQRFHDSWDEAAWLWASALAFHASPPFARAMRAAHTTYREAVEFIESPPTDCEILHIAPPAPLATGRTTQDARRLRRDYALGREAGIRALHAWNQQAERTRAAAIQNGDACLAQARR